MFSRLRLRLTALYLAAGAGLCLAVGLAAYGLVSYYFQQSTDRALQHVMYEHMELLGADVPSELALAEQTWYSGAASLLPPQVSSALRPLLEDGSGGASPEVEFHASAGELALDAELAAVFVLALNEQGRLLPGFNTEASPILPDAEAVEEAWEHGRDYRTVRTGAAPVRLLTYPVSGVEEPSLLQVGRSLRDQQQLLSLLGFGLLGFGGVTLLFLALGSWWLAGRTLRPTETAIVRQQSFVANASHELRAPLTLIRSSAEVALSESEPGTDQARLLRDMIEEVDHMNRLIEDQLLLSRLDAGGLQLTLQPVELHRFAEDLVSRLRKLPMAEALDLQVSGDPVWTQADPTRLRQVLQILLDNAMQYASGQSQIRVETGRAGDRARLVVSDNGPGIPPEDLAHVTDRFYRADKARRRGEGAGLGLSIAESLIAAHRGQLRIESEVGVGTTVTVTLPELRREQADD